MDPAPANTPLPRAAAAIGHGIGDGLHRGAQLYVSRDGRVIADAAFGEARPGVAMTPDSVVLWLSSTKPVAAVAVAQLWERGLVALDDRVAAFISEFGVNGKDAITLRHILTHTAGFRGPLNNFAAGTWDELVARACNLRQEPGWVPGHKAGYHVASSWFVLGELVRRIDPQHRTFDRYVREMIFEPLGLNDAWVGMPPERFRAYDADGRLAWMFSTEKDEPDPHTAGNDEPGNVIPRPGANGRGPIRALGRLYESLLVAVTRPPPPSGGGGGEGARGGKVAPLPARAPRLLNPQTIEAMTARHRTGMYDQTFRHVVDYGLGFIINSATYGADTVPYGYGPHASSRAFGHSGAQSSLGMADPEHGLVIAAAFNGMPGEARHHARMRELLGAIYEDLALAEPPGM
jgi:CubicO group peptidase (beta-lactamase class C family)